MRVIDTIPHPECQVTLFHWNGKYLIKVEKGPLEQTYKVSELDVTGVDEVRALVNEDFLSDVLAQFAAMRALLGRALAGL